MKHAYILFIMLKMVNLFNEEFKKILSITYMPRHACQILFELYPLSLLSGYYPNAHNTFQSR